MPMTEIPLYPDAIPIPASPAMTRGLFAHHFDGRAQLPPLGVVVVELEMCAEEKTYYRPEIQGAKSRCREKDLENKLAFFEHKLQEYNDAMVACEQSRLGPGA
eukprot:Skav219514  [mRNA]  locus=scaffold3561:198915:201548:- [translate_table: standard]